MPRRPFRLLLPALLALAMLAGCTTSNPAANRVPGDPITQAEAEVLANVLKLDRDMGGADVVVTAPYAETATLTLTGQIDFTTLTGTLDAVTKYTDGRPNDTRTIYFTDAQIITGNIPGLADAMAAKGQPGVLYFRRPLDQVGQLVDNLIGMLTRLSATTADKPANLIGNGYTWQGTRTIDGALTSTYGTGQGGATVNVGVADKLLHQYTAKPVNSDFDVTITLSNHGKHTITFPPDAQIADASAYPDVAAQVGS